MRVLVVGATGMLGHEACRTLSASHDVHGVARSLANLSEVGRAAFERCTMHAGFNAMDERSIESMVAMINPEVVLNCVGVVKQLADALEAIPSIRINALLPHLLAQACDVRGAKLIQVSTDCVFSGAKGNYSEEDPPDPVDLYGRSKLLGEVGDSPHLTIRTSIIGRQLRGNTSLLEWFRGRRGGIVRGYARAFFSGLTTSALCGVLNRLLCEAPELSGLFHVSATPISKLALLELINEALDLRITIKRDESFVCDRSLDSSQFRQSTGFDMPSYDAMIAMLREEELLYD